MRRRLPAAETAGGLHASLFRRRKNDGDEPRRGHTFTSTSVWKRLIDRRYRAGQSAGQPNNVDNASNVGPACNIGRLWIERSTCRKTPGWKKLLRRDKYQLIQSEVIAS
jgi:hypothetical protein